MTTIDADQAHDIMNRLRAEIGKAVVGQSKVIDLVLTALLAGGHVLVEGVPGLGKTLLVKALSRSVSARFSRIQFTPDLMPSDVTGHAIYDAKSEQFRIRRGPVFCNFLLADEINRAPAKTQSALLEVMQESQVTVEGRPLQLEPPFMVLATQNPVEHEGTYPLPEAQLDRFLFKIFIDYPGEAEESSLVRKVTTGQAGDLLDVSALEGVAELAEVQALQLATSQVVVDQAVLDYAVAVVRASRDAPGVQVGAGPRGSIALVRGARANALLHGRDYATPDDVKAVVRPALRHRLILAPELLMEGQSPDQVLKDLLGRVEAPRQ